MKAMVYSEYGSPDVLALKDIETPVPQENQVLVRVHAASVNASDWEGLTGKPLYARFLGLFRPRKHVLGSDIAGTVTAVGKDVTQFQPGDEVLADLGGYLGGFAEYAIAPEKVLVRKPADMTFGEAAAMPQASVIALQGIRDRGHVQAGQRVLINGAGGGTGTFAVQLAKLLGAEVTAVDNTGKLEMLRALGADHVIDYTREDFTKTGQRYDLILDVVAHRSVFAYVRALNPGGTSYFVGGSMGTLFQTLFLGRLIQQATGKKPAILAVRFSTQALSAMLELVHAGKIKPVIDKYYPLRETPQALRDLGERRAKGKLIITMTDRND
jgi:NADPH:quinone reductase-like Zn-dependent oxidoreductase